ncbi:MAG TPA: methyltransferase domain-containing protein [Flavisolibacter sp.]|jgi:SAM-dependent methyltransferase|nr:methyltransferase domain-containing protein [Flavisolibacter sp.]
MLSTKAKESMGFLFPILNKVRLNWLRVKYAGDAVYCACCGSTFKEFAPFGGSRRKNAWCPKCESLERHRLLWMYFDKKTDLYKKPTRLLHVAPETIFYDHFIKQKNIDYYPADKFNKMYPEGTHYIDITAIDMPDASFDAIICNHVFQYIEEDRKAMAELYRVLKKGGWAVMQVPINKELKQTFEDPTITDPVEREKAFGLKDHVRFYAMDYVNRLQEAGFQVIADDYTKEFTDQENFKYGFWKGDPVFFCTKK